MKLVHTLLFLMREGSLFEDLDLAKTCLRSLQKSSEKTVVVYNQGFYTNDQLREFLRGYCLDAHVIGGGENTGTTVGRQSCFEYIWQTFGDVRFISELHMDMVFAPHWEDALTEYLETHEEPVIGCGIVNASGELPFSGRTVPLPEAGGGDEGFLLGLREDRVVRGFTCPCVHVSEILKATGGYNPQFLKGKQCFEDDSMLLGYYYYYGTKAGWYPKVSYASVVYHAVAGQRIGLGDSVTVNLNGLIRQYGAMGLRHLSELHQSPWHKRFFSAQCQAYSSM